MTDKATLRRELRRRRMALSPSVRRRAELLVARRVLRLLKPGQRVAAYQALGSELSLQALIALAQARRVSLYLPVVPRHGRRLRFAALADPQGQWRRNRYGIEEYVGRRLRQARWLDVILLPLLGFDAYAGRLGQGGGYYDTTLAFRLRGGSKKPRLVGVGFECQRLDAVPVEPHDVRLDMVISERACYRPRC